MALTEQSLISRVDPRDFASETCRRLFEAARALLREGSPIDAITVRDKSGLGHDVDALILQLMETTPTAANWEAYADLMHEQSTLRQIRAKEYITIGLDPIDKNTFLDHGDVLMIGGAPSDGKTAFALVAAYHMAKTHNVGFYSLETGKEKLEDRLVTSGMQIDFSRIKKQQLTDDPPRRRPDRRADHQLRPGPRLRRDLHRLRAADRPGQHAQHQPRRADGRGQPDAAHICPDQQHAGGGAGAADAPGPEGQA